MLAGLSWVSSVQNRRVRYLDDFNGIIRCRIIRLLRELKVLISAPSLFNAKDQRIQYHRLMVIIGLTWVSSAYDRPIRYLDNFSEKLKC